MRKGLTTKAFIVTESRKLFNEEGVALTLAEIAAHLQVTIGRISNHFPTKDHLFVGLSEDYEAQFAQLLGNFSWGNDYSFGHLAALISKVMDLQYEHRCLMLFAASAGVTRNVMLRQITQRWSENSGAFRRLINVLLENDLVDSRLKQEKYLRVLQFQHINTFTTWLVSYTLYDQEKVYSKVKPIYLKGIIGAFHPFATRKGRAQLVEIVGY